MKNILFSGVERPAALGVKPGGSLDQQIKRAQAEVETWPLWMRDQMHLEGDERREGRPEVEPIDYCSSCGEPLAEEIEECSACSAGSFEVVGAISGYFENPKLYEEYKKGQEDLARFLLEEIERAADERGNILAPDPNATRAQLEEHFDTMDFLDAVGKLVDEA